ncbi:MAG TPA: PAS domain S-box protein [Armatimonadota bacterium]
MATREHLGEDEAYPEGEPEGTLPTTTLLLRLRELGHLSPGSALAEFSAEVNRLGSGVQARPLEPGEKGGEGAVVATVAGHRVGVDITAAHGAMDPQALYVVREAAWLLLGLLEGAGRAHPLSYALPPLEHGGTEAPLLAELLEQLPWAIAVAGPSGDLAHLNARARSLFQVGDGARVPPHSLFAESMEALDPGDLTASVRETGQAAPDRILAYRPRPKGEVRWLLASAAPLALSERSANGVLAAVSFADITDLREAQKALEESRERFQVLFDNSPDAVLLIDPWSKDIPGQIVDCNPMAVRMYGRSREELLGQSVSMLRPGSADPEAFSKEIRELVEELRRSGGLRRTLAHLRKDGSALPLESSNSLVRLRGQELILAHERDITPFQESQERLQASEERYRRLFDHSPLSLWEADYSGVKQMADRLRAEGVTDLDDYLRERPELLRELMDLVAVRRVNQATLDLYRASSPQDFSRGRGSVLSEQAPDFFLQLIRCMEQGRPRLSGREELHALDGTALAVDVTWMVAPGHEGDYSTVYVSDIDVTEQRRLEEQLRQSQKMEAIGQLAGGVAHDFNNLLTAIQGYTEMGLTLAQSNAALSRYLHEVLRATERATSLTAQLLAFSRRQVLEPRVLDLNEVLTDSAGMFRRLIGEHIGVVVVRQPGLEKVRVDPGQVTQVLLNLVVNARDAMPEGGTLTLETRDVYLDEGYARTHTEVEPGRYVCLSVSDTGTGMDQATLPRIFEPFFTTKGQGKGTGLGLSTVYGVVKQSGGSVWVYSEVGKGTTVKVYLPAHGNERNEEDSDAQSAQPPRGLERVLVVEDDEAVRSLVYSLLTGQGYDVVTCKDGQEASQLFKDGDSRFSLLLTDVVMPGMSGRKLAKELQSRKPELKVLFVSGYTDNAIVHHGVLDEGAAFLQKPFNLQGLARKVREVLDGA